MKKWMPWILTGVFAAWVISTIRPPGEKTDFNTREFGRLPVLLNGRVQPLDSVGLNALLSMRGKRTVDAEGKRNINSTEWLLEVMFRPEEADAYRSFRIQHPDLAGLLGKPEGGLEYHSFKELEPHLSKIEEQASTVRKAEEEKKSDAQLRTPFQKDLMHLYESLILYHRLKNSLRPERLFEDNQALAQQLREKHNGTNDFAAELRIFSESLKPGLAALQKREAGEAHDEGVLRLFVEFFKRYQIISRIAYPLAVPPPNPTESRDGWSNIGTSLMESLKSGEVNPAVLQLAAIGSAYRGSRAGEFNQSVAQYKQWLAGKDLVPELTKGRREYFFNQFQPFYKSMVIYVAALFLGCAFWLNWNETLRRSAFYLLGLAFVIHTGGLIFRMFLEARPPVTNLYSSAIFVGWAAALLGLILERIYRDGIGTVTASAIGFSTQIIAHHLSLSGDTMEMLRAVLDTNFWLATHVVVITAGYSSMFIAGFLAIVYILRGVFTRTLTQTAAKSLNRMVYGIVCFSTLFSFVGTILGGIWADQSWGRFWGWDPKENGALLIVIWCAIILHARWGGLIRERGLMAMAVFGNVVTAFSWFGVNMLGVGLHSYGFMDKAFQWLLLFTISQVVLIGLAMLPERFWKSFQKAGSDSEGGVQLPVGKNKPLSAT